MTRVRSNALAMGGVYVTQAIFVLLQIKILTHWLAPGLFGLFSSISALGALLGSLAEAGFSVVLIRYGAKYEAEGRSGD
jgi:O-antigen/teichoic acid export membrane protein